jgi:hypothetical protein
MGSDVDKQVFLGIGEYIKSQGDLPQGDLVVFSGPELCRWASRHLGIPEQQADAALLRLLEKRFLQRQNNASSGDLLTISKRILLRLV